MTRETAVWRDFESRLETMPAADEWLESVAREAGVDESTITSMAICMSEIVNNAIRHGNAQDPTRKVRVEVNVFEGQLWVTVTDEGQGYRPLELDHATADEMPEMYETHGRGVLICRTLCDEIQYETLEPHGTRVRLLKRFMPQASASQG